jgi:uncharacterized protein YkwD
VKKHIKLAIAFAALVTLLFSALPALASATPTLTSYEQQLVKCINHERAKRGLAQLHIDAALVASARSHSADMGALKRVDHNLPGCETWTTRIIRSGYAQRGYRFWTAGENIACVGQSYFAPQLTVSMWMKSPMHRAVLLKKNIRDLGVGVMQAADGPFASRGPVLYFTMDVGRRIK